MHPSFHFCQTYEKIIILIESIFFHKLYIFWKQPENPEHYSDHHQQCNHYSYIRNFHEAQSYDNKIIYRFFDKSFLYSFFNFIGIN